MTAALPPSWRARSREAELVCAQDGTIVAGDDRLGRLLGVTVGDNLVERMPPGTEEKLRALITKAADQEVNDWEVTLRVKDTLATFWLCAHPLPEGQVALLATRLPDTYGPTLRQLTDTMSEVVSLNREISRQKREVERQRSEIEDSNRGVLALHSELAEKADTLRRSSDVKTRLVANVSHEFRTPLHTILGLSKLLLSGTDGPLTEEHQKQIRFIRSSAEELASLVDNLLDLSKAESGTMHLRTETFRVSDLFAGMRGMLRPLVSPAEGVSLVFESPQTDLELETDLGKVSQVLRNLVSNAIKFTERGEIRITAEAQERLVIFRVVDTGIGIAPEHFERIFEEFGQIENELQRRVRGTGLGLPLSRRIAEMLGGSLTVDSRPGHGSTFTFSTPRQNPEARELREIQQRPLDPAKAPILVVEDDRKTIFVYERYLAMAGFQVLPARTVEDAKRLMGSLRPSAIVLDVMLEGETTWDFLAELKRNPETADIPVLVVTVTSKAQKARALGADEFWLKPIDQDKLIRKLKTLTKLGAPAAKVLVIDDEERSRYLMRKVLDGTPYALSEAASGPEGLRLAQSERPNVIFLDFLLRDVTAFDVLDDLKADPRTRSIPVIIITSHLLDASERARLAQHSESIVSKEQLSRELAINRIRDALRKAGMDGVQR